MRAQTVFVFSFGLVLGLGIAPLTFEYFKKDKPADCDALWASKLEARRARLKRIEEEVRQGGARPVGEKQTPKDTGDLSAVSKPAAIEPRHAETALSMTQTKEPIPTEPPRDTDAKLQALIEHPFPEGQVQTRNTSSDGTQITNETLEDGTTVNRAYGSNGELKNETMNFASGGSAQRAYNDSGHIQSLTYMQGNGMRSDVQLGPSGGFAARQDVMPNGDQYIYRYDDSGRLTEKWQIKKDGVRTRML